ncbi:MAG: hypothetical protein AABY64_01565 [Bdellovibrionota bacterium]
MSDKLKRLFVYFHRASFFIPLSVVAGFVGMAIFNSLDENSFSKKKSHGAERTLASFQKKYTFKPSTIEKHLAVVKVTLESQNDIPDSGNASVVLKGKIVLTQTPLAAKFRWLLPEDVQIIHGSTQGQLDPNLIGVAQEVEIEISGFDQSAQKIISLEGQALHAEQTFGATVLLSSRPQDSMEYLAPSMKESVDQLAADREL